MTQSFTYSKIVGVLNCIVLLKKKKKNAVFLKLFNVSLISAVIENDGRGVFAFLRWS